MLPKIGVTQVTAPSREIFAGVYITPASRALSQVNPSSNAMEPADPFKVPTCLYSTSALGELQSDVDAIGIENESDASSVTLDGEKMDVKE